MKRFIAALLVAFSLLSVIPLTAAASSPVHVTVDGVPFSGSVQVKNNTTYVGIRKFATDLDPSASVTYNADTRTLTVKTSALTLICADGSSYIVANGRYLYYDQPVFMKNGTMYAPIMQLYRAFGAGIKWSDTLGGFAVTRGSGGIAAGSSYYRSDEVLWLSRIISAEAKGEPLRGKIAVGNVILNRVQDSAFPNTIYSVIFDKKYGVQFTPAANGTVYQTPTEESIIAAKICLEGYTVSTGILYFVNPTKAPGSWASKNRAYFGKIGNHAFYY
ncbi:MAG: cell wall hydrolase [Clostridia bacterium]|nr:cell wall hydrolase [Clostridia bacterium]